MEEKIKISMLCEFYGKMLTEKQFEFITDYYNNDLSLSEIAQNNNITRQAVRDILKKGTKKLFEYEEKLQILEKKLQQEKRIQEIIEKLIKIQSEATDTKTAKEIEKIKKELNCLI